MTVLARFRFLGAAAPVGIHWGKIAAGLIKREERHQGAMYFNRILLLVAASNAMNNGMLRRPPLGWMSWMYTTDNINEQIVRDVADELVSGGYRDRGFEWLCIDDGWTTSRDPVTNGLRADPVKFPSGIQSVIDYVHGKGLRFGIYADVGDATCGGYAGLGMDAGLKNKQYIADMQTFAKWGVDALKVDGCNEDPAIMQCV